MLTFRNPIAKSQRMLPLGLCLRTNVRQGKGLLWSSICGYNTTKSKLKFYLTKKKRCLIFQQMVYFSILALVGYVQIDPEAS